MIHTPEQRAARLVRLYEVRTQVAREIAEIEEQIDREEVALKRARDKAREDDLLVNRRRPALCGTDSGYHRHRRKHKEDPCEACKLAHRNAEKRRARARAAEQSAA